VSRLTSTRSDCNKIIFRLSTRVTVMITAIVTRDLALPAPSGGGPVAVVVGFDYLSYYLRRVPPGRSQARRTASATTNGDQLADFVMGV
jgi:hypothetical protein